MSAANTVLAVEGLEVVVATPAGPLSLVDTISFSIGAGRTLCLVGESGCGKSLTALAVMGLLAQPLSVAKGKVALGGEDLTTLGESARAERRGRQMTMIFQEPMTSLNPAFRIGAQICEVIERHQPVGHAAAKAQALDMLRRVRIAAPERRFDDYPHQLSGGMRQRVMIAMALANSPRLLIADEPTTALDVTIQAQILGLIGALQRETGTSMLLITHDLGVVAEIADDVAVMYGGRIVEAAPAAAIFDNAQHPYTLGLLASLPSTGSRTGRLVTIPGSVPPPDQFPPGCRFAPRCPYADSHCFSEAPKLDEIERGHRVACWKAPLEDALGAAAMAEMSA